MTTSPRSRWRLVADKLESLTAAPSEEQKGLATAIGISIPADVPAPVAAVILRDALSSVLLQSVGGKADIPEALTDLEGELGLTTPAYLTTGSRQEISAWFHARYMLATARGLYELQPELGDVVSGHSGTSENRVISSIGDNGRVYFKGRGSAWPNHLRAVARAGTPGHPEAVATVEAALMNSSISASANFAKFAALEKYALDSHVPAPEAVRALEELLDSGEKNEAAFQTLLTSYPELLASTVMGGWKTYVIPKPRLGAEYVPDFLVLGINSIGPQWVAVEIEAARHGIVNRDGTISTPTRHALKQISDWREWLSVHVAYAQNEHGLYGLTSNAPGLIVIGRDVPSANRQAARAQSEEHAGIKIHSWDWLLRHAQNVASNGLHVSEFALDNVADRV